MPDVLITNEEFIQDAARKASALGLNSFVIFNFTYGNLYVLGEEGRFCEARTWAGTNHIRTREDVAVYKEEWVPVIRNIILTINELLQIGALRAVTVTELLSNHITTNIINRNKDLAAEHYRVEVSKSMMMERRLSLWWKEFQEEYDKDETNMYSAYSKVVLLNWTNRIMFANIIRKYHNCADFVHKIDNSTSPADGNDMIDMIIAQAGFYNVFHKIEYNDLLPENTWNDIVDYNQLLYHSGIDHIDQRVLQEVLEETVNLARREMRGLFTTPSWLADLLCQITVDNWNGNCGDLCAGTGTIAKALITNKMKRLKSPEHTFATMWVSDKQSYPLWISNIALTSIFSLNIPINLFQEDIFQIETGKDIIVKSPIDGSDICRKLPKFDAIVSNLPFVKANNIASDEFVFLKSYADNIKNNTGITFKAGKMDFYMFVPFKIHELLANSGRLGIVLSNSWLGTEAGNRFCLTRKEHNRMDAQQFESLIDSIVLGEELDSAVVKIKSYTLEEIERVQEKGISLNALFHDVSWICEMQENLVPIEAVLTVKRGERRGWNDLFYPSGEHGIEAEYLKPVLKNPANLKSYTAGTDITAFCCHRSVEELQMLAHTGAAAWIKKFENLTNGTGKLLPEALRRAGTYWYEMNDGAKADFVTALNPDKRLFVAKFEESTFVDQRFTRLLRKDESVSPGLVHALLNSVYGMFAMEAVGFGRGLGVLDASSSKFEQIYMIHPKMISDADAAVITELFGRIKCREVMDVEQEFADKNREEFDRKVLQAIGKEHLYERIKETLLSMQRTRHTVL